jgi:uncharacterized protein (DUF427 family)
MSPSREPDAVARARARWRRALRERPPAIVPPGPGQESVWDYPRPPRVEPVAARVAVEHAGVAVADTRRALRVLETAGAPTYYLPTEDVRTELLEPAPHTTLCEWKGLASYWTLRIGDERVRDAAWSYRRPDPHYAALRGHFAFHAGRVDTCTVGGERVTPQPGAYYGGWITRAVVGPFKGGPGTESW